MITASEESLCFDASVSLQALSKELVKVSTEMRQLRDSRDADDSAVNVCNKTLADLEDAKKRNATEQDKAMTAVASAIREHDARVEELEAKRAQYEAEMGLCASNGEVNKNVQVSFCTLLPFQRRD